ncbi:MAG: DUF481 domain-containing protein [Acidobacteria bacterium]|nr:DUF481 domain-containing protein [Acidobacteriota bacterium]
MLTLKLPVCPWPFAALLLPSLVYGADLLVLSNGDTLRGEIKKLDGDVITFSTDYSDEDFRITWSKVVRVESERHFLVEQLSGVRLAGTLQPDKTGAAPRIGDTSVPLTEMVMIRPYETSFRSRLEAGFDLGFNMTKANATKQLTAGTDMRYEGERFAAHLSANAFLNRQANAPRTRRWEVSPDYRYLFGRSWYSLANATFFGSREQQLDLRSSVGGGIGRYFIRSSVRHLAVAGGAVWTRERYTDGAIPLQTSGESFLVAEYGTKRLKLADVLTRFHLYPSLTRQGRYRSNFTLELNFNLPGDWYMKSSYFNNYDSTPPAGLPRNDFGWRNGFGYNF